MKCHLAEFNFGTLRYPWDDPRIAGFQNAIEQVNGIAARSPGFIWRLPDDDMEFAQEDPSGALKDCPNTASTLSMWEDAGSLYRFVTKTLHARIMKGAPEWFVPGDSGHLVCWWVPQGHRPDVAEGMEKWHILKKLGPDENIFDANALKALAAAPLA